MAYSIIYSNHTSATISSYLTIHSFYPSLIFRQGQLLFKRHDTNLYYQDINIYLRS